MESNIDDQILLNRKLVSHEDKVLDTWLLLLREIRKAGLGAKKSTIRSVRRLKEGLRPAAGCAANRIACPRDGKQHFGMAVQGVFAEP